MDNNNSHISSYFSHGKVLTALLTLTFITVLLTWFDFGVLTIAVVLLVASIKAAIVLIWFMHLKFENTFMRWMVAGVFILFVLVLIVTFIDYFFR
jgi:cytochrome c oxidase subunit IV